MKPVASAFFRALFVISLVCGAAIAPSAHGQSRPELKERFKQRDPAISQLKSDGKIGETWEGFVDVVSKDKPLSEAEKKLMDEENSDRRKLYESIASKSDIRETATEVGINNGMRNFASAKADEYLKVRTGPWVMRGDVAKLKNDGKIGETWRGYVQAVTDKAAEEPRVAAVVMAENLARKYIYERDARKEKISVDQQEERAGRRNLESARAGEFIQGKDGKWSRKK